MELRRGDEYACGWLWTVTFWINDIYEIRRISGVFLNNAICPDMKQERTFICICWQKIRMRRYFTYVLWANEGGVWAHWWAAPANIRATGDVSGWRADMCAKRTLLQVVSESWKYESIHSKIKSNSRRTISREKISFLFIPGFITEKEDNWTLSQGLQKDHE